MKDLAGPAPRFNIAPTQEVPVVMEDDGERRLTAMRWGLIPHWMKAVPTGRPMINARAETVAEKPSFRTAFRQSRCLIPADGFYEWAAAGPGAKQPYYIQPRHRQLFAFAGLYSRWRHSANDAVIESCCIVTRSATGAMADLHHRLPIILTEAGQAQWLAPGSIADPLYVDHLDGDDLVWHAVSKRVNRVANDDASLIAPLTSPAASPAL